MDQDGARPVCSDVLSDEDLAEIIVLAQLVTAHVEPRLPVQAMFMALAQGVLDLRRRLYDATGVR
jgi:hypothetical protein